LKKVRGAGQLPGWVATIEKTCKILKLEEIKRTCSSRSEQLLTGDIEFIVEDFEGWVAQ
jgi:hypothetical protein